MKNRHSMIGFTLIELLVVISIMGILITIVSVSFVTSQKQARDVQRKSDLKQYQNSLENYANGNNGLFPLQAVTVQASETLCDSLNVYFEPDIVCPEDTKYPTLDYYKYQSNGSKTIYILWSQLEGKPSTYWVVCSNGRTGEATSGIPPAGGTCPI